MFPSCSRRITRSSVSGWAGRIGLATALATGALISQTTQASAGPIQDLQAQARQLEGQIQQVGQQASALSEKLDGANIALAQTEKAVSTAQKQVQASDTQLSKARRTLTDIAVNAYMSNGSASDKQSDSLGSANKEMLANEYEQSLAAQQSNAADTFRLASETHASAQADLQREVGAKKQTIAGMQADRQQLKTETAHLEALESHDKGQIAVLIKQQQEAQAAAQRRAALARLAAARAQAEQQQQQQTSTGGSGGTTGSTGTTGSGGGGGGSTSPTTQPTTITVPSNGSLGQRALAAALTRVGDPYVYGAAGPGSFDCSGLVMWSYEQVGVSLPHYSGAQYADTTHIPMSDIQPGDLLFFSDPGQHVAMYAGNGNIIQAPYTGADVQVIPIYSELTLASRVN